MTTDSDFVVDPEFVFDATAMAVAEILRNASSAAMKYGCNTVAEYADRIQDSWYNWRESIGYSDSANEHALEVMRKLDVIYYQVKYGNENEQN